MTTLDFGSTGSLSLPQMKIILESIPANVFFKDTQGRYRIASHLCEMIYNGDQTTIFGKTDMEIQPDPVLGKKFYEEDMEIVATGKEMQYMQEMVFDGVSYFYEISKMPVKDDDGQILGIIGIVQDMTEKIRLQRELERSLQFDSMTGAYNRSYYNSLQEGTLPFAMPLAVVMADCNNLKYFNDNFGHTKGDELIITMVENIRRILGSQGQIIRLGGDEFVLLIPACDKTRCERILQEIRRAEETVQVCGIPLSTAYGYSIMEDAGSALSQAVDQADRHMYQVKAETRPILV